MFKMYSLNIHTCFALIASNAASRTIEVVFEFKEKQSANIFRIFLQCTFVTYTQKAYKQSHIHHVQTLGGF